MCMYFLMHAYIIKSYAFPCVYYLTKHLGFKNLQLSSCMANYTVMGTFTQLCKVHSQVTLKSNFHLICTVCIHT